VALELQRAGWPNARALVGGWQAWQESSMPIEAKSAEVADL
jgi:3-mercaptopyruvate sulfurtransferase SseA